MDALVTQVAAAVNLPADLLAGQVRIESAGDTWAFRHEPAFYVRYIRNNAQARGAMYGPLAACSYGLLQIMFETALELGFDGRPEDLFVPRIGLLWGAKKMRALWDWAGGLASDYPQALAAYNAGIGNAIGGPPFVNQTYVDKVYSAAGLALPGRNV